MAHRSVYLHNNQLTNAGLPDHMFNGSDNLEIITMSSNFLQVVPKNLPSTLYRLHLKVWHLASLVSGAGCMMYVLSLMDEVVLVKDKWFTFLQNNKLEKIPPGAFDNLSNLRELYLQNNHLTNEGMNNETFRWTNTLTNKRLEFDMLKCLRAVEQVKRWALSVLAYIWLEVGRETELISWLPCLSWQPTEQPGVSGLVK